MSCSSALGGRPRFTQFWRSLGDTVSRLDRYEPELNDTPVGTELDTTTPRAKAMTTVALVHGNALAAASRAKLKAWMADVRTGMQRVRAGFPSDWKCGDKTGTGIGKSKHTYVDIAYGGPEGRSPVIVAAYFEPANLVEPMDPVSLKALADVGSIAAMLGGGTGKKEQCPMNPFDARKLKQGFRVCAVFAHMLLAACANQPNALRAGIIVDHVTVLDGRGGAAIPDARVTVVGDRIARLEQSSKNAPNGERIIDGRGKVPLARLHRHARALAVPHAARPVMVRRALIVRSRSGRWRQHLAFGITTVRSPATPTVEGLRLRDDLNAGRVRGPRAFASAELINDASMNEAQLRQTVRDALPNRPDYFKVYSRLRPDQVAIVVDEAHRHQVAVIGHLQRTSWAQGLDLGIDHLAHAVDWSSESLPLSSRAAYAKALNERDGFFSAHRLAGSF